MTAQDPKLLVYLKVCCCAAVMLGGIVSCSVLTCVVVNFEAFCCKAGCLGLFEDKLLKVQFKTVIDRMKNNSSPSQWQFVSTYYKKDLLKSSLSNIRRVLVCY